MVSMACWVKAVKRQGCYLCIVIFMQPDWSTLCRWPWLAVIVLIGQLCVGGPG